MAFKLKGKGGIDGKQPYFKQHSFGPRADFTIIKNNSRYDDKALDKKEDEAGVGGNSNKKVMVDGGKNQFNVKGGAKSDAAKEVIAKKKAFDKMTEAEKAQLQKEADKRRADFEASDEYKKRVSGLKHVPWDAGHKQKAAHPNTAEAHGELPTPAKKYASDAQRKAIYANKADGGKGHPDKKKKTPLAKRGLWDNIHAKRKRGEKMRKKGEKGAPTEKAIRDSQ